MRRNIFQYSTLMAAAVALIGCVQEEDMTILDAAALYETNQNTFDGIRDYYPGPYNGFSRVPARDPAKETRKGKQLIEKLRASFSVEFIDFFPMGDTGKDEMNIMLKRYGSSAKWTIISLVYAEVPLPPPTPGAGIALFDACDSRALGWFEQDHGEISASAFCRINDHWYAYQKVY